MCPPPGPVDHTDFATGFYKASPISTQVGDNFVGSPASLLVLLSVLLGSTGPQGATKTQVCRAILGHDTDCSEDEQNAIKKRYMDLLMGLDEANEADNNLSVKLANAAFIQQDFTVLDSFISGFKSHGASSVEQTNFQSGQAVDDINAWVKKSTEGMIEKLYNSQNDLSGDTVMVLLNTIFFKGNWMDQFTKDYTQEMDFHLGKNSVKKVQMMFIPTDRVNYVKNEDEGYHAVAKPFKDPRFKFFVILPTTKFDLASVNSAMDKGFDWSFADNNQDSSMVDFRFPKMKIEHEIDMKPVMKALGIEDLFMRGKANLSGISTETSLYTESAKQKSIMEIDEHGVKAAAVTSMSIMPMSMPLKEADFTVDEPFICGVRDTKSKETLFVARVVDPPALDA